MARGAQDREEAKLVGERGQRFRRPISDPSPQEEAAGIIARLSADDGHLFHIRLIDRGDWLGPDDGAQRYDGNGGYAGPLVEVYEATSLADRATSTRGWFLGRWPVDEFVDPGFTIDPGLDAGGEDRRFPTPDELRLLAQRVERQRAGLST